MDENTLPAFNWAVENGCHGLEFDVQLSRDGVPFVFHDATLTRLTGGRDKREVQGLSMDELRTISLQNGGQIPALKDLLRFNEKLVMNLEIKSAQAIESAVKFVKENALFDWVVSSFLFDALVYTRSELPKQPIGYLLERGSLESMSMCVARAREQIERLKPDRIHLDDALATVPELDWLRSHVCPIHVWTVNEQKRGALLKTSGVAGIFTDDVRLFT